MKRLAYLAFLTLTSTCLFGQGSAFTYQGRLNDGASPATGTYDLRFAIYAVDTGGAAVGGPMTNSAVPVSNGVFTVVLDFGANAFNGNPRWLEIGVRSNGSPSDFTTLTPRQPITPTPYAIFAGTAATVPNGAITSSKLASGAAAANLQAGGQSAVAGGGIVLSEQANAIELLNAGYTKIGRTDLVPESWLARAPGPPPFALAAMARSGHSAVWTGTEIIIWGGFDGNYRNNGARYNPASNTWAPISTNGAPFPRAGHSAVWTGTEMIVYGGGVTVFPGGTAILDTGGRYNPATDTWTSITNGGGTRRNHTAFWTPNGMLVWGGSLIFNGTFGPTEGPNNSGALYVPSSDTWTPIASSGLSGRLDYSAVWTGTEMIIWGGQDTFGSFVTTRTNYNDGARYNPAANTWTPVNTVGAPFRRESHSAVWSGSEMIVWGGANHELVSFVTTYTNLNTGARYNPAANSWAPLTTTAAPSARYDHTAAWIGNRMTIWGGTDGTNVFNSGARYFPSLNIWSNMTVTGRPTTRTGFTQITTPTEMIIWGGQDTNNFYLDVGGRYNPSNDLWQAMARSGDRSTRRGHTAVWTGGELLVWGGFDGENYLNGGGRFNPALNSWTPMNATNAPAGRIGHTAVWTGTEMIIWGGTNTALLNSGAKYNPISDTWSNTATASAPTGRIGHSAVWSGSQMIVWGGYDGAFRSNGARFNPAANTWTAMATAGAPAVRADHAAVWTGTDMLVWGGRGGGGISPIALGSGARYNPLGNTWSTLPTAGAPAARAEHTSVWTGEELLVWGGTDLNTNLNSGGRYHVVSNSWNIISMVNAPGPRSEHTAVWAGTRMMIWGGLNAGSYLNTGGGYDPLTDLWIPTATTTNAPAARSQHVGTWTGSEMIIHGGWNGTTYFDDTYQYAPPRTMYLYLKP